MSEVQAGDWALIDGGPAFLVLELCDDGDSVWAFLAHTGVEIEINETWRLTKTVRPGWATPGDAGYAMPDVAEGLRRLAEVTP